MADYTSTQAGDWNNVATWGGGGYPDTAGDTAAIGHAVAYNVGDAVIALNNVTLNSGGTLTFPINADSTIKFDDTAIFTINDGGKLAAGTEANPVDKAYHCKFHWAQGASARYVFVFNDGAEIEIWGDPDYYSNTRKLILESAWDASAGDTLYVDGDQTLTWPIGALFWLNKGYASGEKTTNTSYQTDSDIFEIASIGAYDSGNDRTPITVASGHGSTLNFLTGQQSLIISRNVELGDPGCSLEVYSYNSYTENIRFDHNQFSSNDLLCINHAMYFGWYYACYYGNNFRGKGLIFVSNWFGFRSTNDIDIEADFVSNYYGMQSVGPGRIIGDFCSNLYGTYLGSMTIIGTFISNGNGMFQPWVCKIIGDFISNWIGLNDGDGNTVFGNFSHHGYCGTYGGGDYGARGNYIIGSFDSNDIGLEYGSDHLVSGEFTNNNIDFNIKLDEAMFFKYYIVVENSKIDGVFRPLSAAINSGDTTSLKSSDGEWQTPESDTDWIIKMAPNQYCNAEKTMFRFELDPTERMAVFADAGVTIIRFKIYPVGWTTALTDADVETTALYLDNAVTPSRSIAENETGTYNNGGWRYVDIPVSIGQDGMAYIGLFLKKYEAGCYILIDPIVSAV